MQWTVVERAFRVLKSELLLRPIGHPYSGRTEAHVFVCVLAHALWKTLDPLAKRAGLMTEIRKPDPARRRASPKARPMTPTVMRSYGSHRAAGRPRRLRASRAARVVRRGHKCALPGAPGRCPHRSG